MTTRCTTSPPDCSSFFFFIFLRRWWRRTLLRLERMFLTRSGTSFSPRVVRQPTIEDFVVALGLEQLAVFFEDRPKVAADTVAFDGGGLWFPRHQRTSWEKAVFWYGGIVRMPDELTMASGRSLTPIWGDRERGDPVGGAEDHGAANGAGTISPSSGSRVQACGRFKLPCQSVELPDEPCSIGGCERAGWSEQGGTINGQCQGAVKSKCCSTRVV